MSYQKQTWTNNVSSIDQNKMNHIEDGIKDLDNNKSDKVTQIAYDSWHSIILTRTDSTWLSLMLYGSNHLKEGNYSIANDFNLILIGSTNVEVTIPTNAITIIRRDWGFELNILRSGITGDDGNAHDGIAIVSDENLVLKST